MSQRRFLIRFIRTIPATCSAIASLFPGWGRPRVRQARQAGGLLGNQSGAALIGAIALSILLGIMAMGYMQLAANAFNQGVLSLHNDDSFNAAESGLLLGTSWLKSNYDQIDLLAEDAALTDIIPLLKIGGVGVQVDVVRTHDGARIEAWARDHGSLGYDKIVSQDVESLPDGPPFGVMAFDYAIVCGGEFKFAGCGDVTSDLKLHANEKITISGDAGTNLDLSSSTAIDLSNNITVNGSVRAPKLDIPTKAKVTGSKTVDAVDAVSIPDIDLTAWRDVAMANGQVYSSLSDGNYTPPGGVIWVNGNVTLIATGNIHISGKTVINSSPGGFALASQSGSITMSSSGAINGLIYARAGDYTQTSNGNVTGQLVIKGDISKGGNSDVMAYKQCIPVVPGHEGESENGFCLVVGSWRESNAAH
jgi:hypothetical protein